MPAGAPRVRFGLILLPEVLSEFGPTCREAEDAGFELLGVADSQSVFREVVREPHRGRPGHPPRAPGAAGDQSSDAASGGDRQCDLEPRRVSRTAAPFSGWGRETARSIRWARRPPPAPRWKRRWPPRTGSPRASRWSTAGISGGCVTPSGASPSISPRKGPQTLRLAGRVADGIIVGLGLTPGRGAPLLGAHRGGRARRRGAASRTSTCGGSSNPTWRKAARRRWSRIKMALAASANHAFRFTLEGKGLAPDLHEQVRGLRKEYEPHHHEVLGATPNAGLTDRWGLTDYLADRFAIAGTPEECAAAARSAAAAGAPSSCSRASSASRAGSSSAGGGKWCRGSVAREDTHEPDLGAPEHRRVRGGRRALLLEGLDGRSAGGASHARAGWRRSSPTWGGTRRRAWGRCRPRAAPPPSRSSPSTR